MEMLQFLRFDNKNERSQRLEKDKFALVSRVWNTFIENKIVISQLQISQWMNSFSQRM